MDETLYIRIENWQLLAMMFLIVASWIIAYYKGRYDETRSVLRLLGDISKEDSDGSRTS